MPRGHGRSKKVSAAEPQVVETVQPPSPPPVDPTSNDKALNDIFFKTKMCKFHILGVCARGDQCLYAHSKEQLIPMPDLSYTKLCPTLIRCGQCKDSACKFAHDRDELRISATHRGRKLCKINVRDMPVEDTQGKGKGKGKGKGGARGTTENRLGNGGTSYTPPGCWPDTGDMAHEQVGRQLGSPMPPPGDMTGMTSAIQAQMLSMQSGMPPAPPEGQSTRYPCQPGLVYNWSPADYAAGVPGYGANGRKFPNMWMVQGWSGEEAAWSCAETTDTMRTIDYDSTEGASPGSLSSEEVLAPQNLETAQQDQSSVSDITDDPYPTQDIMITQQGFQNFGEADEEEADDWTLSQGTFLQQVSRTSVEEAQFGYFDDLEGIKVSVKNTFLQFEDEESNFKGLRKVFSTGGRLDQLAAGC